MDGVKLIRGCTALACLCALTAAPASAQTEQFVTANPSAGAVSSQMEVLGKLVGKWRIEEAYPATADSPEGASGKGQAEFKQELDDAFVFGEYKSKSREMGTEVSGHSVLTYDDKTQAYRYWWFDNYGNAGGFTGEYDRRKNALIFTRVAAGNNPEETPERHTFTFKDDDTVVFTMEWGVSPDTYEVVLTTTYSRKGGKKTPSVEDQLLQEQQRGKSKAAAVPKGRM